MRSDYTERIITPKVPMAKLTRPPNVRCTSAHNVGGGDPLTNKVAFRDSHQDRPIAESERRINKD